MPNWKHNISFSSFWGSDMSVEDKGARAANQLRRLAQYYPDDYELQDIIEMFECISGDGTEAFTVTDDFNARMFDLYEWADSNRVWIRTL